MPSSPDVPSLEPSTAGLPQRAPPRDRQLARSYGSLCIAPFWLRLASRISRSEATASNFSFRSPDGRSAVADSNRAGSNSLTARTSRSSASTRSPTSRSRACSLGHRWRSSRARILRRGCCVPSPRIQSMATASKSSGKKARRKTTSASKRSSTRAKSATKTAARPQRKSSTKVTARSGTRKSTPKRAGTRAARKQSPVTRIKRVATTVLHQGATAAKQGVQAVAGLVENVKDRVTT